MMPCEVFLRAYLSIARSIARIVSGRGIFNGLVGEL